VEALARWMRAGAPLHAAVEEVPRESGAVQGRGVFTRGAIAAGVAACLPAGGSRRSSAAAQHLLLHLVICGGRFD
jgi:hypothetical protein